MLAELNEYFVEIELHENLCYLFRHYYYYYDLCVVPGDLVRLKRHLKKCYDEDDDGDVDCVNDADAWNLNYLMINHLYCYCFDSYELKYFEMM